MLICERNEPPTVSGVDGVAIVLFRTSGFHVSTGGIHGVIAARSPPAMLLDDGGFGWLSPIRWKFGLTIRTWPGVPSGAGPRDTEKLIRSVAPNRRMLMKSRGPYRLHSTPFKLQLCQDIRIGVIGRRDAQRTYGVSANPIQLWLTQFDRGELSDEEADASVKCPPIRPDSRHTSMA